MGAAKDTSDVMDDANVNEALPPVPTTAGAPADAPAGPMPAGGGNRAVLPTAVTPMDPVMAEIKQSLTRLDTALTDLKLQAQHDRKELEDLIALNAPPPAPATDTDLTNTASADSSSTSESEPSEAVDDEPSEVEPPAAEPPVQAAAPAADAPPPIRLLAFGAKPAAAKTAPTSTDQHRRRRQKYVSLGVSRFRQSPQYVPLRDDLYRHQNRASIKAFTKAFVKSVDAYLTAKRLDKMQALDELRAYEAMDIEMPLQYLRGENAEKLTENDRRRFYTQRITAPPTYAAAAAAAPSTIDEVIAQRDQGCSTGGGGGGGGGGYGGKRPGGGARDSGKPKKIRADRNTCRHCFEHFANGFPAQHLQDCAVLKRKKAMAA